MQRKDSRILIIGSAPCLHADLSLYEHEGKVMAINEAGVKYLDNIDYWITAHPAEFSGWKRNRELQKGNSDYETHTCDDSGECDRHWEYSAKGGSGLFAILIAIEMGFDKIVIAGMSLDGHYERYREDFKYFDLQGKIKCLSGYLMDCYGFPDEQWLYE